jgi:prepilin-type processing-associated H-X9-DG protein
VFAHFRLRELIALLVICGLGAAALAPALERSRESARQRQCADHLRAIGVALRQYHDAQDLFPPAAVWEPGDLNTLMLYEVKRFDRIVHQSWAQLLLPHLGRSDVAALFDTGRAVMAPENKDARLIQLAEFTCPTDTFNGPHNLYGFQPWDDRPPLAEFARGNYAINGGSHCIKYPRQDTIQARGEIMQIVLDQEHRRFEAIGNGIAGINHSFRCSEFANSQATLVAVDEIRAGIHSLDMRGVWALGHIGSSITWAHGVVGDASGPNSQWDRSDDLFDCGRLHKAIGSDRLTQLGMPCCSYIDHSEEATARSLHPRGVHVLFLDGAVRFVRNEVDPGLWHVMHSRDTPAEVLAHLDEGLWNGIPSPSAIRTHSIENAPASRSAGKQPADLRVPVAGATFTNSIGMRFVGIPPGRFKMGVPDEGNSEPPPPECPIHEVAMTRAFWLGQHEVTQAQYTAVTGTNPSQHLAGTADAESTDDFPVENVTWYDAAEFCRLLSETAGEAARNRKYRLPTEAEWEYACRSGQSEPYRWSGRRQPGDNSGEAAGIEPPLPLTKVGSYPANESGLHDMRGNVWEWCRDWFDRAYYSRSPRADPQGPAIGYLKVVRGSDWIFVGDTCRINCQVTSPWHASPMIGFRVVCEAQDKQDGGETNQDTESQHD